MQKATIYINAPDGLPFDDSFIDPQKIESMSHVGLEKVHSTSEYPMEEEEGEIIFDMSYITYMPNTFTMFHEIYASIQFNFNHITKVDLNIETSVSTCDNMKLRIFKSALLTEIPISISDSEFKNCAEIPPDMPSSTADSDEWTRKNRSVSVPEPGPSSEPPIGSEEQLLEVPDILERTCVEIECNNLLVHVLEDRTTIQTQLRKFGCDENAKCDLMVR